MFDDDSLKSISEIKDFDLVKLVVRDDQQYPPEFVKLAAEELAKRAINVEEGIIAQLNQQPVFISTLDEALSKLNSPQFLFDVWAFTNYLKETIFFQKTATFWLFHYIPEKEYTESCFVDSLDQAEMILRSFLSLKDWELDEDKFIDHWEILRTASENDSIVVFANVLDHVRIPFMSGRAEQWHFNAVFGTAHNQAEFVLFVPEIYLAKANQALEEMQAMIDDLYRQLEETESQNDSGKELEIYNKLARLTRDDSVVFYNQGLLLLNQGKYQTAADAAIKATEIMLEQHKNAAELADCDILLNNILEKLPENVALLHCLAVVSSITNETEKTIEWYTKILAIHPADSAAHLNIGYLYYENEFNDHKAIHHFQKYLELEPASEDVKAVKKVLAAIAGNKEVT